MAFRVGGLIECLTGCIRGDNTSGTTLGNIDGRGRGGEDSEECEGGSRALGRHRGLAVVVLRLD